MTEAELHSALADIARTSRRGGYDVDEEAEVLARAVHAYAAARLREVANEAQDHGTVDEDWAVSVDQLLDRADALDPS